MEHWAIVKGHPRYEVSDHGRVYSTKTNKLLTQRKNNMGYLRVTIDKKQHFVHRLVANAFVEGSGEMVNHKDFNPENNTASNLEWTDRAGNMRYSAERGRFCHNPSWRVNLRDALILSNGKTVRSIAKNGDVQEYECVNAVRKDGHLPSSVSACCNGKRKSHHGLQWEFI